MLHSACSSSKCHLDAFRSAAVLVHQYTAKDGLHLLSAAVLQLPDGTMLTNQKQHSICMHMTVNSNAVNGAATPMTANSTALKRTDTAEVEWFTLLAVKAIQVSSTEQVKPGFHGCNDRTVQPRAA